MAEKAETPKPAKEKKAKPAEPKKAEAPAPAEKPEKGEGSQSKKINKMTLAEIQAKLEETKAKQGGLRSKYAHHLLHKKSLFTG
jgi:hypothetical protein